jgi:hypothetical protein
MLAEADRGPSLIVLDAIPDLSALKALLTDKTQSLVVATAQRRFPSIAEHLYIRVGALEPAEGLSLVRQRLPDLSSDAAAELVEACGRHALALRACWRTDHGLLTSPVPRIRKIMVSSGVSRRA